MAEHNILLVDDHHLSQKLLAKQLETLGLTNIDFCSNGLEGLEQLREKSYDIVIFDWSMPVMDGLEFFKKTQEETFDHKVAFIMLSAESEPARILEALEAGISYYLIKPATQEKISETVEAVMKWLQG